MAIRKEHVSVHARAVKQAGRAQIAMTDTVGYFEKGPRGPRGPNPAGPKIITARMKMATSMGIPIEPNIRPPLIKRLMVSSHSRPDLATRAQVLNQLVWLSS